MSELRNATASWSWYLHQWKVGVFIALKKIVDLLEEWKIEDDLKNWRLIYENAEDFDIQERDNEGKNKDENGDKWRIDSRHQVKAYKNWNNLNDYKWVLEETKYWVDKKWICWFEIKNCEKSEKYLHTICEIIWFWLTEKKYLEKQEKGEINKVSKFIPNPNYIKEYTYPNWNKYCNLSTEDPYLQEITNNLIKKIRKNYDENIYFQLLFELDEEIRDKHINWWFPELSFYKIKKVIDDYITFENKDEIRLRESFVKFYIEYKQELEDEEIDITKTEEVNDELIKKIYLKKKEEFFQFLRNIHPDRNDIIDSSSDSNIESAWLKDVFFEGIFKILEKYSCKNLWYIINNEKYLLTTIIRDKWKHISRNIIENWKITTELFEWNFIVNKHIAGKLDEKVSKLKKHKNTNWDKINYSLWEKDLYLNPKNLSFVKINDLIPIDND